jgi:hypothetical protein
MYNNINTVCGATIRRWDLLSWGSVHVSRERYLTLPLTRIPNPRSAQFRVQASVSTLCRHSSPEQQPPPQPHWGSVSMQHKTDHQGWIYPLYVTWVLHQLNQRRVLSLPKIYMPSRHEDMFGNKLHQQVVFKVSFGGGGGGVRAHSSGNDVEFSLLQDRYSLATVWKLHLILSF